MNECKLELRLMHKNGNNRLIGDGEYGFIEVCNICDGKNGRPDKDIVAEKIIKSFNSFDVMYELALKVSHLNPDNPEIGAGMLKTLVNMADDIISKIEKD